MSAVPQVARAPARSRGRPRRGGEDRHGRVRLHRIETAVLLVVGLVFAVATVYDLARQVRIDDRLHADLVSWQAITGAPYRGAILEAGVRGQQTRDVVCGGAKPAAGAKHLVVCLIFEGPVKAGHRRAVGGYYLRPTGRPARRVVDRARYRYGCFGAAAADGLPCRPATRHVGRGGVRHRPPTGAGSR
jgi:hypothetical protein